MKGNFNPKSVPGTLAMFTFDKNRTINGTGDITSWSSVGTITGNALTGEGVVPTTGRVMGGFGEAITTGLTVASMNVAPPFTMYILVAPNMKSRIAGYVTELGNHSQTYPGPTYRIRLTGDGTNITVKASAGKNGANPSTLTSSRLLGNNEWVRIKAVFNGASSTLKVEDVTTTGLLDIEQGDINGTIAIGAGGNPRIAHWQFVSGVPSPATDAALWNYMGQIKSQLPVYPPTIALTSLSASRYQSWGTVAYDASEGKLVAAYSDGTAHLAGDQFIGLQTSADNGATWTAESTVIDPAVGATMYGGLQVLSTGRWIINYSLWDKDANTETGYTIYSDDKGGTWSSPVNVIPTSFANTFVASGGPIVELPNGNLILGMYVNPNPSGAWKIVLFRSTDGGETWTEDSIVEIANYMLAEPTLKILADGSLVMLIRCDTVNRIYRTTAVPSANPLVWSTPTSVVPSYSMPGFTQLADGRLLLTVRGAEFLAATSRQTWATYLSSDNGLTWTGPLYLFPHTSAFQYGWPIELGGITYLLWFLEGFSGSKPFWSTISGMGYY